MYVSRSAPSACQADPAVDRMPAIHATIELTGRQDLVVRTERGWPLAMMCAQAKPVSDTWEGNARVHVPELPRGLPIAREHEPAKPIVAWASTAAPWS